MRKIKKLNILTSFARLRQALFPRTALLSVMVVSKVSSFMSLLILVFGSYAKDFTEYYRCVEEEFILRSTVAAAADPAAPEMSQNHCIDYNTGIPTFVRGTFAMVSPLT